MNPEKGLFEKKTAPFSSPTEACFLMDFWAVIPISTVLPSWVDPGNFRVTMGGETAHCYPKIAFIPENR
jgi:hypothetical protein